MNMKEMQSRYIGRIINRGFKRIINNQLLYKCSSYIYSELIQVKIR